MVQKLPAGHSLKDQRRRRCTLVTTSTRSGSEALVVALGIGLSPKLCLSVRLKWGPLQGETNTILTRDLRPDGPGKGTLQATRTSNGSITRCHVTGNFAMLYKILVNRDEFTPT